MSVVTYRKQCDCKPATASGPRIVGSGPVSTEDGMHDRYDLVQIACDRCNTPWLPDRPPRAPNREAGG